MNRKQYHVYIMTNTHNSVFYTGASSNLPQRVFQHKNKLVAGFTQRYNIWKLVYYEEYSDPLTMLEREKQVKDFRREKKLELIKSINPNLEEIKVT